MKSSAKKIELASVDDLFSTEEGRQDAKLEKIQEIPLSELHPFKNHPFKVKDDEVVLCQEKVQIKYNQFSLCLAKLNLLFLSHFLLDFSDILPHIGLGINTRNGCEYVLYCKMFLCIQKSTYMHVYN